MSERRKVQSALFDASFRLEDAARHLEEAKEYLKRYDFLQEANPGLHGQLQLEMAALRNQAVRWLDFKVES